MHSVHSTVIYASLPFICRALCECFLLFHFAFYIGKWVSAIRHHGTTSVRSSRASCTRLNGTEISVGLNKHTRTQTRAAVAAVINDLIIADSQTKVEEKRRGERSEIKKVHETTQTACIDLCKHANPPYWWSYRRTDNYKKEGTQKFQNEPLLHISSETGMLLTAGPLFLQQALDRKT